MNDTNFENNTEINSVHSEAKAQGHGGVKAMAIFFAITTLALGSALAYVYTSKNKDTKKLNEELVESKEKVKSANESIAKYEEATQTKITDVKQDNVTVKEIVKPMAFKADWEIFKEKLKKETMDTTPYYSEVTKHRYQYTFNTASITDIQTSNNGQYLVARGSLSKLGHFDGNTEDGAYMVFDEPLGIGSAGPATFYKAIPSGEWKILQPWNQIPECSKLTEEEKAIFHDLTYNTIYEQNTPFTCVTDKNETVKI